MTDWVIMASGPSLCDEDVELVRESGAFVACVNDTWRKMPDADLMYAADRWWWQRYHEDVAEHFEGERWTQDAVSAKEYGLNLVRMTGLEGFDPVPGFVRSGQLSGYQCINLVAHKAPDRIILLGYDMQHTGGRAHWFGKHPEGWPNVPAIERQRRFFNTLAHQCHIPIINCTRETALECFERMPLRDALK